MKKKIVYVEPGDMIEIRVCDPIFDEGANKGAWEQSIYPSHMLLEVDGYDSISIIGLSTRVTRHMGSKKIPLESYKA